MKVMQAARKAATMSNEEGGSTGLGTAPQHFSSHKVVVMQKAHHGSRMDEEHKLKPPPLDEQPSDSMIKAEWTFCETGQFGFVDTN